MNKSSKNWSMSMNNLSEHQCLSLKKLTKHQCFTIRKPSEHCPVNDWAIWNFSLCSWERSHQWTTEYDIASDVTKPLLSMSKLSRTASFEISPLSQNKLQDTYCKTNKYMYSIAPIVINLPFKAMFHLEGQGGKRLIFQLSSFKTFCL